MHSLYKYFFFILEMSDVKYLKFKYFTLQHNKIYHFTWIFPNLDSSNSFSSMASLLTLSKITPLMSSILMIRLSWLPSRREPLRISMPQYLQPGMRSKKDPGQEWLPLIEPFAYLDLPILFKNMLMSWLPLRP